MKRRIPAADLFLLGFPALRQSADLGTVYDNTMVSYLSMKDL